MSYGGENERFLKHAGFPGDLLGGPRVGVELTSKGAASPDGAAAFMLAANILCRLFRDVRLIGPDIALGKNPWRLSRLSDLLLPLSELCEGQVGWGSDGPLDAVLGIGSQPDTPASVQSHVSFSGWRFGLESEVEAEPGAIFGALAGACYGCSQLFLKVAARAGGKHRPMQPFEFSLLNYSSSKGGAALPEDVNLGSTHLVGVGAVGCAAVYVLGHLQKLSGQLTAVDNDGVDASNLQRYVLMRRSDVGARKVEIARATLRESGTQLHSRDERFDQYKQREHPRLELLLTPVDSEDGRRRMASELSRRVINVATGGSMVTVSRHGFADGRMCLACLYPPARDDTAWQVVMAKNLGLPVAEVLSMLETNQPADAKLLRQVERHRGLPIQGLAEFEGKALQTLYQRAVCGTAGLETLGGTVIAPLPFISALGGVLLAAEWTKEQTPELAAFRLHNYFRADLFKTPNPDMREERTQRRGCICADADYVDSYRERWGAGGDEN